MTSVLHRTALYSREEEAERVVSSDAEEPGDNVKEMFEKEQNGDEGTSANTNEGVEEKHRKKRRIWGGNMTQSVKRHDGNLSRFSDECLSVHGLYYAFYSENGWLRTVSYLCVWLVAGAFFLYLTIPLIEDYTSRTITTSVDTESGVTDGLPLPILTVCPHGRGIRCDCLLWRKLHCRYLNNVTNDEWRERFSLYGCFSYFDVSTNLTSPAWINPMCEDFEGNNEPPDKCGPSAEEIEAFPGLVQFGGKVLFDRITARESRPDGPYIRQDELALYAPTRIRERVFFMKEGRRLGLPEPVPEHWVNRIYLETSQLKVCVQVRPPPDEERQYRAGALTGVSVVVTHVKEDEGYPIQDVAASAAAVDIHVNTIGDSMYDETYLPVESHSFEHLPAGHLVEYEYGIETLSREKGWGPTASRRCKDTPVPRSLCAQEENLNLAAEVCGCNNNNTREEQSFYDTTIPGIYGCSATRGTIEYECTANFLSSVAAASRVPIETCPTQCFSYGRIITSQSTLRLSEGQASFLLAYLASIGANTTGVVREELVYARYGAGTLVTEHLEEAPKTSFSALMGQIGGNAGLWCGLSFVLMFEVLEFCTVAGLYALGKRRRGNK